MMKSALLLCLFIAPLPAQEGSGWRAADARPAAPVPAVDGSFVLPSGTRIPLVTLTAVSTRNAAPGQQVYLQTLVPIAAQRRILIPAGSHVTGTITQVARPGKVKGKGQLFVRFDSILFPSGVQLDLSGKLGALDGDNAGTVAPDEGAVTAPGGQGRDAMMAGGTALGGAAMGSWIGGAGSAAGIGAGAGAAAGLAAILLTRGPDAVLPAGGSLEMVLQRDLRIAAEDLPDSPGQAPRTLRAPGSGQPRGAAPMRWRWPLWGPWF
jgi:type IV secretion system protein VirB10